jgi:ligand-binding sensor domain-containing protein
VTGRAISGEGNLWIGTVAGGLFRYRDGVYTAIGVREGLPDPRVSALSTDRDGAVWVGTYGAGLVRIHHGVLTTVAASGPAAP